MTVRLRIISPADLDATCRDDTAGEVAVPADKLIVDHLNLRSVYLLPFDLVQSPVPVDRSV